MVKKAATEIAAWGKIEVNKVYPCGGKIFFHSRTSFNEIENQTKIPQLEIIRGRFAQEFSMPSIIKTLMLSGG
jgi:hypothetical protein